MSKKVSAGAIELARKRMSDAREEGGTGTSERACQWMTEDECSEMTGDASERASRLSRGAARCARALTRSDFGVGFLVVEQGRPVLRQDFAPSLVAACRLLAALHLASPTQAAPTRARSRLATGTHAQMYAPSTARYRVVLGK